MPLIIYNSLTKNLEEFIPIKKGEVKMYTCGPTVYNYAHIGNFFAYLFADTFYRWLKYGEKLDVTWVLNITDVEDKTIRDSKIAYPLLKPMDALKKHTDFYLEAFYKDMEILNIKKESFYKNPRVTHYIEAQKKLVRNIFNNGYAYISDGSVYFSIKNYKKDHKYGRLVHIDEGFQDGIRVDNDEYDKENAADFVLWKGMKEGEPYWEFELDNKNIKGRPGWHLECSAMEYEILGVPFDVHTGGMDLKFPHHEDEIAQSCGGYREEMMQCNDEMKKFFPTKYWLHNGYLKVEGEKMAKSKGNFYLLSDLIIEKGYEPELVRFLMISNHYRKDFNFTENGLHAIKKNLNEIREVYKIINENDKLNNSLYKDYINLKKEEIFDAMRSDINTPKALSILLEVIKYSRNNINKIDKKSFFEFIDFVSKIFGIDFSSQKINIPQEVINLAEKRQDARKNKDFAMSDQLRDEILKKGFIVKDTKKGFEINIYCD